MEGSTHPTVRAWLRCYRCWSQELEVHVHYDGIHRIDAESVETCSGPDAADSLAYAAFGDHGTREFFTHVRFHKHDDERIVVHLLVELYARSSEEANTVPEEAARGVLTLTSLAEESRPPAHAADEAH